MEFGYLSHPFRRRRWRYLQITWLCFFLTIQAIQRQLEEVAEKQRDVEERGVEIEKILRGETERGKPHTRLHRSNTSIPRFNEATHNSKKCNNENINLLFWALPTALTPFRQSQGKSLYTQLMALFTIDSQVLHSSLYRARLCGFFFLCTWNSERLSFLVHLSSTDLQEPPQTDDSDESQLYQTWFQLVLEKNRLARYESELMIL